MAKTRSNIISQLSPETLRSAEEFYTHNDITLEEMSQKSTEIFGQFISIDVLKILSSKNRWSILRANNGRKTSDVPYEEKLSRVADKLYELIIDEDAPLAGTAVSQIARTWVELVTKTNMTKFDASARVSSQRVKDIFAELEAESNNG